MRWAATFLATALVATPALAGDHLEPEDSVYSGIASFEPGYDQALIASFRDAFEDDVQARAIVEPSFETEFAVGIKETEGHYWIFYQEVSEQLWQYSVLDMMKKGQITSASTDGKSTTLQEIEKLEKSLPPDPKDVKVIRCEYQIERALGVRIVDVWRRMLLETRYSKEPTMGLDGTIYHFYAKNGYRRMAGQTWTPDPATKPGILAEMSYDMKKLCTTRDVARLRELETLTNTLSSKLGMEM